MKRIENDNMAVESSNKWIEIKYNNSGKPYFLKHGRREFLSDYIRLHNSAWSTPIAGLDFLHGVDSKNSYCPDYIEISNTGEAVKIWYSAIL